MISKPSIPKGTRDFGPKEMAVRNYIFDTVRSVFRKYGYAPVETPAMENLSTLLGKYGEEGDRLLFKILNSGDAFSPIKELSEEELETASSNALALKVCEKGLRYDLTVPFARYVVQHRNELTFPFKRYQIQPVWRADRPQKGRYREFYQCDVDVIGTRSLLSELELVQIADEVFTKFDVRVCIKINNRKILSGLADITGRPDKLTDITVAIDKIDKIGLAAVKEELLERGLSAQNVAVIEPVLTLEGNNREKLSRMKELLSSSETGMAGIAETETLLEMIDTAGINSQVELDLSLARGLNYYTGAIFEVKALDFTIGSICGGGRFDNLTGIFGMPDTSGAGISFGADRIYDVLLGLEKFPKEAALTVEYLFANTGDQAMPTILQAAKDCRNAGHSAEVYPEAAKLKKQFEYADKKGIHYVVIAGEDELAANELTVKDMSTGNQTRIKISEIFKN